MFLSAAPGLGSVSGVVHLAVRRPYIVAIAVVVFAALAFTNSTTNSIPAFAPRLVPAAPVVHTRQPSETQHQHAAWQAIGHRQDSASKQRLTVKQRPVV
jgi:hypothetical protein